MKYPPLEPRDILEPGGWGTQPVVPISYHEHAAWANGRAFLLGSSKFPAETHIDADMAWGV
jgi:hypothetical protein